MASYFWPGSRSTLTHGSRELCLMIVIATFSPDGSSLVAAAFNSSPPPPTVGCGLRVGVRQHPYLQPRMRLSRGTIDLSELSTSRRLVE